MYKRSSEATKSMGQWHFLPSYKTPTSQTQSPEPHIPIPERKKDKKNAPLKTHKSPPTDLISSHSNSVQIVSSMPKQ
jgi:hypothetical protein